MSDEYLKACANGVKGAVEQYLAAGGDPDAAAGDGGTGLVLILQRNHHIEQW